MPSSAFLVDEVICLGLCSINLKHMYTVVNNLAWKVYIP